MSETRIYSPDGIIMTWGRITFQLLAEDEFVKVTRTSPLYTKKVGADGEGARARSADKSGSIEVTLLTASPTNDLCSAEVEIDEVGLGAHPFQISDLNGASLVHAPEAWIAKLPDFARGKEIGELTWMFDAIKLAKFIGGNLAPST